MGFRDSDRGQAMQVGAILLFGFLVIGLSLYQAAVVPQETKATEFESYLHASDQLVSLHDDVLTAATRGVQTGTTVQTGVRYQPRVLFVNPGPPTGSLSLSDPRTVTISGAEAVSGEPAAVRAVWNGSTHEYESSVLRYTPNYNQFDGEPVTLTGTSVQREAGDSVIPLGGQTLVSGNRITVVSLVGRIGETGVQTPLTVRPVSTATRTVTVTNSSGADVELTVPVGDNATAWNRSPAATRMREDTGVLSVTDLDDATDPTNSLVRVALDGSKTYELRLAKVELTSASAASAVPATNASYLVPVTDGPAVAAGGTTDVVVEVRDRFDNPVEGEDVEFTTGGSVTPTSGTVTTTDDGRAAFEFSVPSDATGNVTVVASSDLDGSGGIDSTTERVTYSVPVVSGNGSGTGSGSTGEINPPKDYANDVILRGAVASNGNRGTTITLENTGQTRNIKKFRVSFYYPDQGGNLATQVSFNGSPTQDIGGKQYNLSMSGDEVELPSDTPTDITLTFSGAKNLDTRGDFFILTVRFDNGTPQTATYFVAVP